LVASIIPRPSWGAPAEQAQDTVREAGWRPGQKTDILKGEQGAQAGAAALGAHPRLDGRQQQSDEKHALVVIQVRQVENAHARAALRGIQKILHFDRLTLVPGLEGGGSEEIIQQESQLVAFFGRKGFTGTP
jgi:hypothetical protein